MDERDGKQWISDEFSALDLGDERLNKRAKTLMADLAAKPSASIPMACNGWSETLAAYRFLGNDKVDWREILAPHWSRTEARMGAHPVVLCLQDTTELDFNGQDIAGLGPLNYEARRGMYVHPTYAVTPQREALGVLDAWIWAREARDEHGERGGLRESARWVEGYERIAELATSLPTTRLVYVADREADMVELMLAADRLGNPADWLIRAQHDRCLPEGEKLWAHTCAGAPLGEIVFMMASRQGQKAREVGAPAGVTPVEWRLLTNRSVATVEEVVELIDWYRARWEIERFFQCSRTAAWSRSCSCPRSSGSNGRWRCSWSSVGASCI